MNIEQQQARIDNIHAAEAGNRQYLRRLTAWSKLCAVNGTEVHIWQYLNNGQFNYPLPIFHGLPDLIRTFRDLGGPEFRVYGCGIITCNGETVHDFSPRQ